MRFTTFTQNSKLTTRTQNKIITIGGKQCSTQIGDRLVMTHNSYINKNKESEFLHRAQKTIVRDHEHNLVRRQQNKNSRNTPFVETQQCTMCKFSNATYSNRIRLDRSTKLIQLYSRLWRIDCVLSNSNQICLEGRNWCFFGFGSNLQSLNYHNWIVNLCQSCAAMSTQES